MRKPALTFHKPSWLEVLLRSFCFRFGWEGGCLFVWGFFGCYFLFYLDREIFFTGSLMRVSDKRLSTILLTLLSKPEFWTVDLYKRMTCEQLPKSKWD